MRDIDFHRLEYKLDLVIRALQDKGLMLYELPPLVGMPDDACPVCNRFPTLSLDLVNERVLRSCHCELPVKVVSGISKLLRPPEDSTHGDHLRPEEARVPPDEEEGGAGGR